MKIAVAGSSRTSTPEVLRASERLGRAIAAAGHTLVVGSTGEDTADHAVLDGAVAYGRDACVRVQVEHYRRLHDAPILLDPGTDASLFSLVDHFVEGSLEDAERRLARRIATVFACDALIVVGGSSGTRRNVAIAEALRRPVISVPCFGGAAAEAWERHLCLYRHQNLEPFTHSFRNEFGLHAEDDVVFMCERLGRWHPYFITYARRRGGIDAADHVEVLLRRRARVFRDEASVRPGQPLEPSIRLLLATSRTIVVVWDKQASASEWVNKELQFAREIGREVIFMVRDDTKCPDVFADPLYMSAATREQRDSAVGKVLFHEQARATVSHQRRLGRA